jgi:undecaprenyl-diphosphatase
MTYAALVALFWASTNATEPVAHPPSWARTVGEVGGWTVLPAVTALLGLVLVLAGRSRTAVFMVGAVVGAGLLAYGSKVVLQLVGADDDEGRIADFPSTHAATIVAFTGALTVLIWRGYANRTLRALTAALAIAVSVAMGWARVAQGSHAVIDVFGGASLGVAWLATWMLARASIRSIRAWLIAALTVSLAGFALLALAYDEEPLTSVDRAAAERVASSMPSWAEWLARPPSWLGGWIGVTALALIVCVVLLRERAWLDLAFVLTAVAGSQIVVSLLKAWFDRPRPHLGSVIAVPPSASFPSGHATAGVASLGAAVVLAAERIPSQRARTWLWTLAVIGGLAVGASRIVLDVHYVTDVLAGWCLGLAWLAACLLARERILDQTEEV